MSGRVGDRAVSAACLSNLSGVAPACVSMKGSPGLSRARLVDC